MAAINGRVRDSYERVDEYRVYILAILANTDRPLHRQAIVARLRGAGFVARRTRAGGFEDRTLATQRVLETLYADGLVTRTTNHDGDWLWTAPVASGGA